MALNPKISKDEHAKLADALKAEYKAEGDGFLLDVTPDGGLSLHDSSNLTKALEAERGLKAALEKQLAPFKDIDPEAAKEALRNKEIFRGGADDRLKAVEEKYKTEVAAEKDGRKKDADAFHAYVRKQRTVAELAAAKGNEALLLPHVLPHVGVAPKDGDFEVFITDEKGVPRVTKTPGASGNMSVSEYLLGLRADEKFRGAFYSDQKSGNGTPPGSGKSSTDGSGKATYDPNDMASVRDNFDAIADGKAVAKT